MSFVTNQWYELETKDVLHECREDVAAKLRAVIPSTTDLSAEAAREIRLNTRGVEIVKLDRENRHIVVGGESFTRTALYAKIMLEHEEALVANEDHIRQKCLKLAREIGVRIASQICPPPGASVSYTTAIAKPPRALTVRAANLVQTIHDYTHDRPARIFQSMQTDEVWIYFVSRYTIAPAGRDEAAGEKTPYV